MRTMHLEEVPTGLIPSDNDGKFTLDQLSQLLDEKVVNPFNQRFKNIEDRIDEVAANSETAINHLDITTNNLDLRLRDVETADLPTRVSQLETAFKEFQMNAKVTSGNSQVSYNGIDGDEADRQFRALFKQFDIATSESEAITWLEDILEKAGAAKPQETFCKGADFKGTLFCRFNSPAERDRALLKFRLAKPQCNGHEIKCKPDLPVDKRFVYTVLFGIKYLVCSLWSVYSTRQVKVDLTSNVIKIQGATVLTVVFENGSPKLNYTEGWEEWLASEDWSNIVRAAQTNHSRAQGQEQQDTTVNTESASNSWSGGSKSGKGK